MDTVSSLRARIYGSNFKKMILFPGHYQSHSQGPSTEADGAYHQPSFMLEELVTLLTSTVIQSKDQHAPSSSVCFSLQVPHDFPRAYPLSTGLQSNWSWARAGDKEQEQVLVFVCLPLTCLYPWGNSCVLLLQAIQPPQADLPTSHLGPFSCCLLAIHTQTLHWNKIYLFFLLGKKSSATFLKTKSQTIKCITHHRRGSGNSTKHPT